MLQADTPHFEDLLPDAVQTSRDFAPLLEYIRPQQLLGENLDYINENETTVQPATVQAHVEDTYTPGDRLAKKRSRRVAHRRQAPCVNGFPCDHGGCDRVFDRACELK